MRTLKLVALVVYEMRAQVPCALAFAVSVNPLGASPANWLGPTGWFVGVGAWLAGPAGRGVVSAGATVRGGVVVGGVVVGGVVVGGAAAMLIGGSAGGRP